MARVLLVISITIFPISMCTEPSFSIEDLRYKTGTNALAKMTQREVMANIEVLRRFRKGHWQRADPTKENYPKPDENGPVLGPLHRIAQTRKTEGRKIDPDLLQKEAKSKLQGLLFKLKTRGKRSLSSPTEHPLELTARAENFGAAKAYVARRTEDEENRKNRSAEREAHLEAERRKGVFYRRHPHETSAPGSQSKEDTHSTATPQKIESFNPRKLPESVFSKVAGFRSAAKPVNGGWNHLLAPAAA